MARRLIICGPPGAHPGNYPNASIAMTAHTYAEIASSFELWREYVDTTGTTSREEFDAMTTADRIAAQIEAFGPEPEPVPTVDTMLASTAIGNGWHDWPIEGGSIRIETAALRIALKRAHDPSMPNWASVIDEDDIEAAWRCSPAWIGKTESEKIENA